MSNNDFQIVPAYSAGRHRLESFFRKIKSNKFFHPHPLNKEQAYFLWRGQYENLFYVIKDSTTKIIGYGFLRGFDEGWDDICLGIYILERRKGFGELLMHFLHVVAKRHSVQRIRLHVHPDNKAAFNLYKKLGYEFGGDKHNGELIGYKNLNFRKGTL